MTTRSAGRARVIDHPRTRTFDGSRHVDVATDSPSTWAKLITSNFISLRVSDTTEDFRGSLQSCDLGEAVTLTTVDAQRSRVIRDRHSVRSDAIDDLLLLAPLSGTGIVRQEGAELVVPPGSVSLHVADRPYELVFERRVRVLVFQAPRRILPSADLVSQDRLRTVVGGAIGPVFAAFATAAVSVGDRMNDCEREELRQVATGLAVSTMTGAILPATTAAGGHGLLTIAAKSYIRSRLADSDLTPAVVARSQGASLRSLQMAFEKEGSSPAAFIRQERLRLAQRIMVDPRHRHRPIEQIASLVGYPEVNGFIRAFKRQVGSTPNVWRHERQGPVSR